MRNKGVRHIQTKTTYNKNQHQYNLAQNHENTHSTHFFNKKTKKLYTNITPSLFMGGKKHNLKSNTSEKLDYTTNNDRFFDYCHYNYFPKINPTGKLRSNNLLINSCLLYTSPSPRDRS